MPEKPEKKRHSTPQGEGRGRRLPARGTPWPGAWQEWASVAALVALLYIVVRSVTEAEWIIPQPSLTVVLLLALATGLVLAKSRIPGPVAFAISLLLGMVVGVWQCAGLQPETGVAARLNHLISELGLWWQAISSGEPSPSTVQIALLFSLLTWFLGFVSVWFILRKRNPWIAVFLGAFALLLNISNLPEENYDWFLWYLLIALLLVALTTALKDYSWFGRQPAQVARWGIKYLLPSFLCFSILILSISWLTPAFRVDSLRDFARTSLPGWGQADAYLQRFFAVIPAQKTRPGQDTKVELHFTDLTDTGNDVLYVVKSERPSYWWTRIYDLYTSQGWLSSPGRYQVLKEGLVNSRSDGAEPDDELTYSVIPQVLTSDFLSTGELVRTDFAVKIKALTPLEFNLDLDSSPRDSYLPEDIDSLARDLRLRLATGEISQAELEQNLPQDLKVLGTSQNGEQVTSVQVARTDTGPPDVVGVLGSGSLMPKQRYTVTVRIPTPTRGQLAQAGEDYPKWITDRYLQLPTGFSERVRRLAGNLARNAETPYQKAVAIRQFLLGFPYTEIPAAPPAGTDGVVYFLFTAREGNCVYFASALVVMLRSVGVPARLNVGYIAGEWDEESRCYVIRGGDCHAWPEVYFPGYGWIDFETTPGRSLAETTGGSALTAEPSSTDLGLLAEASGEDLPPAVAAGEEDFALAQDYPGEAPAPYAEEPSSTEAPPVGTGSPGEDLGFLEETTDASSQGSGATGTPLSNTAWLVLVLTMVMILPVVALYLRVVSGVGLSRPEAIYARMCFLASLLKLRPQPQQTALEFSALLSSAFPHQAQAIDDIVQTYVSARYSYHKVLAAARRLRLQEEWRRVHRALLLRLLHLG